MLLVGAMLVWKTNSLRKLQDDRWIRYPWAISLLGIEIISWIYFSSRGFTVLPLHLCDWALFLMAASLLGGKGLVSELAFFWGLAGCLQAILTPDLEEGFFSYPWFSFFFTHSAVVLGALYLLVRGRVEVTPYSPWRVWLFSNFYVLIAGLVNWRLGTNFGYLARKPDQPSLLDYLGPWPYYIFWVELIALGLFFLCYLLAYAVNQSGKKSQGIDPGGLSRGREIS